MFTPRSYSERVKYMMIKKTRDVIEREMYVKGSISIYYISRLIALLILVFGCKDLHRPRSIHCEIIITQQRAEKVDRIGTYRLTVFARDFSYTTAWYPTFR